MWCKEVWKIWLQMCVSPSWPGMLGGYPMRQQRWSWCSSCASMQAKNEFLIFKWNLQRVECEECKVLMVADAWLLLWLAHVVFQKRRSAGQVRIMLLRWFRSCNQIQHIKWAVFVNVCVFLHGPFAIDNLFELKTMTSHTPTMRQSAHLTWVYVYYIDCNQLTLSRFHASKVSGAINMLDLLCWRNFNEKTIKIALKEVESHARAQPIP